MATTIQPVAPPPATKIDPAPKTTPRANPGAIAADKAAADAEPFVERRRNPDRRRRPRGDRVVEQRLGADRRKRTIDISI